MDGGITQCKESGKDAPTSSVRARALIGILVIPTYVPGARTGLDLVTIAPPVAGGFFTN